MKENRNEDTGTYLNTNTSDDHEYQVLIFPEPVRVISLINFRIVEPGVKTWSLDILTALIIANFSKNHPNCRTSTGGTK